MVGVRPFPVNAANRSVLLAMVQRGRDWAPGCLMDDMDCMDVMNRVDFAEGEEQRIPAWESEGLQSGRGCMPHPENMSTRPKTPTERVLKMQGERPGPQSCARCSCYLFLPPFQGSAVLEFDSRGGGTCDGAASRFWRGARTGVFEVLAPAVCCLAALALALLLVFV